MTNFKEVGDIYCNGAFLTPYQQTDGRWGWRVTSFEDDSYECWTGQGNLADTVEIADTREKLLVEDEEE